MKVVTGEMGGLVVPPALVGAAVELPRRMSVRVLPPVPVVEVVARYPLLAKHILAVDVLAVARVSSLAVVLVLLLVVVLSLPMLEAGQVRVLYCCQSRSTLSVHLLSVLMHLLLALMLRRLPLDRRCQALGSDPAV